MSSKKEAVLPPQSAEFHQTFKAGAAAWERARDAATKNSTALATSLEATLSAWGRLQEHALATGTRVVQDQIAAAVEFSAVKTPAEAFEIQTRFARKALDSCVDSWTIGAELVTASFNAATRPLSARFEGALNGKAVD